MNSFPTDIFTLIENGGFSFLTKNQNWPVNDKKFNKIIKRFHDKCFSEAEKLENLKKNILYIDVGFLYFISNCVHFRILIQILKKRGKKIKIGKYSKIFIKPNLNELSNPFYQKSVENKLILSAKFIIKNLLNFSIF